MDVIIFKGVIESVLALSIRFSQYISLVYTKGVIIFTDVNEHIRELSNSIKTS